VTTWLWRKGWAGVEELNASTSLKQKDGEDEEDDEDDEDDDSLSSAADKAYEMTRSPAFEKRYPFSQPAKQDESPPPSLECCWIMPSCSAFGIDSWTASKAEEFWEAGGFVVVVVVGFKLMTQTPKDEAAEDGEANGPTFKA
jgi:hypothetical protein